MGNRVLLRSGDYAFLNHVELPFFIASSFLVRGDHVILDTSRQQ